MAQNKNQRRIEVFRAVTHLRRARPADVIRTVAPILGEDESDVSFRRAIHRDLKALLDSYQLGVDYFTPQGDPIPPGEEMNHSNFRVEYFIPSHSQQDIQGSQRFIEKGGVLLFPPSLSTTLHFCGTREEIPKNTFFISVHFAFGSQVFLWFFKDDRPLTLLFARMSSEIEETSHRIEFIKKMPKRMIVLLLPHQSISRLKKEGPRGHASFLFDKEEGVVTIEDHNSSKGTSFSESLFHSQMLGLGQSGQTMENPAKSVDWQQVDRQQKLSIPFSIKLGDMTFELNKK
ncbi:MAG: hypothetical protein AAF203_07630 [Pseudomonadota bacterium]